LSWVTVTWSTIAAASLTLAGVHGFVWLRQRETLANLMFALLALGTAGMAACELAMMQAATPATYGVALRWFQVPVWIAVVSLAVFVRLYLKAGRGWLAAAVVGLRTLVLAVNFLAPTNVNYRAITGLRQISFLGEPVAVPVGVANPWMLVAQLSLLLLLVYVVDATRTVWRRGERRAAWLVGGSTVFFVLTGTAQAIVVFWGLVPMPLTPSLFFTGLVTAMGYELSSGVLRAAQLAGQLQEREAELQRERALTDAVFDSVPGLLYLYTAEGKLLRWNRQHETRTGYTSAEMAGRSADDWFPPEDVDAMRAAWQQVFGGGNVSLELPIKLKDGSQVPYLLTGVRLMIDGRPHLVGIGIDVAQRKAMELETDRQRAELAHLARVATLTELSGALAHELNQPLAIILSNAQAAQRLLARDPPDLAEVRDILADIVAEDRRAGQVILRLRALLKRGEPERRPLGLNEVVLEVVALMRSELIGRSVLLSLQLADDLPRIWGDRIPLQQVLLNLVTNACDAVAGNPPGERRLTIQTRADEAGVRLSVADNGCGLPPDAPRVFDSFYTTKPHGLGMGLPICRTLVEAHGGRIWTEANADRGATFHVSLPHPKGGT
jgi:PAS domain S-box-containing protein